MTDAGYRIHTVGPGDTIQAIGDVYGVDWTQIVSVNGLMYPYIDTGEDTGDYTIPDGVARIGRSLIIPTGSLMFPVRTNDGVLDVEQYILGADLDIYTSIESANSVVRIGDTGELSDDDNGDLLIAKGIRNLRQQLVTRLGVQKGTLLLHPEYGSDILRYIGRPITQELLTDVRLCVQECILTDSRVERVSDLVVQAAIRQIRIDCIIHAIEPFGNFRLISDISSNGASVVNM